MGVFDNYFPLGLGTSRFPINGPKDISGIEKSIKFVSRALELGINYIDTSYTYSAGMAQTVLKEAFASTKKPFGVTIKVMRDMDKTADDVRRRTELQLKAMGLQNASFFVFWNITSYEQFQSVTQKDGIYEEALKLKKEGLIEHICASVHVPPKDIVKIIASGAFEGITVSYNLLNAASMQIALDTAQKHNVGVVVMNPLAGGLIPQNPDYFSYACGDNENVTEAALRFVKAHPAVKVVLSGINNEAELRENLRAISEEIHEPDNHRLNRVVNRSGKIENYCTGCNYCDGCPQNIPISEIMKNRNRLIFKCGETYNRTEPDLVKNINLFYRCEYIPETAENLCIKCGICEKKCTQKLNIIDSVSDFYERAKSCGYSLNARKKRIREIFENRNYGKIGLYPNGGFSDLVIDMYYKIFGKTDIKWFFFNSNDNMRGQIINNITVNMPQDIPEITPDIIIVCSYKYEGDIYKSLKKYENAATKIIKLHKENDVPWVW